MEKSTFGLYQNYGCFISGKWVTSSNQKVKEVSSPTTGELIGLIPVATESDLQAALESAQKGFNAWRVVSPWERSRILRKTADLLR